MGIKNTCPRSSVKNIEAQLEVEKRANGDLRCVVDAQREQLEEMKKKQAEMEAEMKKKQAEMEAKIQLLLTQNQPS